MHASITRYWSQLALTRSYIRTEFSEKNSLKKRNGLQKRDKNILAAGYNGPRTVNWWDNQGVVPRRVRNKVSRGWWRSCKKSSYLFDVLQWGNNLCKALKKVGDKKVFPMFLKVDTKQKNNWPSLLTSGLMHLT